MQTSYTYSTKKKKKTLLYQQTFFTNEVIIGKTFIFQVPPMVDN